MPDHVDAGPQATQAQPQRAKKQYVTSSGAPAMPAGIWAILQGSIGNRAVGRLVEARRTAANEGVDPVSPWQQSQIETVRSCGESLAGAPGVRLHRDPLSADLAQSTRVTHASESRAMAGTVQREPAAGAPAIPPPAAAAESSTDPKGVEHYTLTMSDGIHDNLTKIQALALLNDTYNTQQRALDQYSGEWGEVNKGRLSFFGAIGGALTDLAGKNFPSYEETWKDAYEASIKVRRALRAQDVKAAAEALKTEHESYVKGNNKWSAYKAQLDSAALKAEIGIVVVAVLAVVVVATGGAAAAVLAPEAGAGAGAAGAGGMGAAGAGGGGVGAGGGIAGGTVAGGGAAGGGAVAGGGAAGSGAVAGGATIPGVASTIPIAEGGVVAGGGQAGAAALGTTGVATGAGVGAGAVGGGVVAGVAGGEAAAVQTATVATVSAMEGGGAAAARGVASSLATPVLQNVLARLTLILTSGYLAPEEQAFMGSVYEVVKEVWMKRVGMGGFPGPPIP